MNGYWRISSVILPDGEVKKYENNLVVDYIKLEGKKGFKKKLHLKIDGSIETSDDAIPFLLIKKADKGYFFSYNDSVNGWQEAVNFIGEDFFSVKNQDGLVFCYDRQEKPNFSSHAKTGK